MAKWEYAAERAPSVEALVELLNKRDGDGWELYGGVLVLHDGVAAVLRRKAPEDYAFGMSQVTGF